MTVVTGRIGYDASGETVQYVPPNVVPLDKGVFLSYGAPVTLNRGDSLPPGFWQLLSGRLNADIGGATIRQVTID